MIASSGAVYFPNTQTLLKNIQLLSCHLDQTFLADEIVTFDVLVSCTG